MSDADPISPFEAALLDRLLRETRVYLADRRLPPPRAHDAACALDVARRLITQLTLRLRQVDAELATVQTVMRLLSATRRADGAAPPPLH